MKVISKSPFDDTDSEDSKSESESDGAESDEDVDMKSVAEAYAQGDLNTDEDDEDYVESGSSDSEASHSSEVSIASSVATGENSEVSDVSVSSEDEGEPMSVREGESDNDSPRSRRYKFLFKEINDDQINLNLPASCGIIIDEPNELHNLKVQITPFEGYWLGGTFTFELTVPEEYNEVPPEVKCLTKVFHPCIGEDGSVGLSILCLSTDDSDSGWKAGGQLLDVVLGINSLFNDPINSDGAINAEAAKLFEENKEEFEKKVRQCIRDLPMPK